MQKIFLLILSLGMILLFNQAQTKSANLITQQQTSCVICLKNLDEKFLPFCVNGHQFHKPCISQLFSYTKFACCPNCRSTEYSPELIQFFQKKAAKIELYRVSGCKKFLVFSQNPNLVFCRVKHRDPKTCFLAKHSKCGRYLGFKCVSKKVANLELYKANGCRKFLVFSHNFNLVFCRVKHRDLKTCLLARHSKNGRYLNFKCVSKTEAFKRLNEKKLTTTHPDERPARIRLSSAPAKSAPHKAPKRLPQPVPPTLKRPTLASKPQPATQDPVIPQPAADSIVPEELLESVPLPPIPPTFLDPAIPPPATDSIVPEKLLPLTLKRP